MEERIKFHVGLDAHLIDAEAMWTDALRSRQLGFGGKLCIHPRQVAVVNKAFVPTSQESRWALAVVAAFDASKGAVTSVNGKMIDKPIVDRAQRIVADGLVAPPPETA